MLSAFFWIPTQTGILKNFHSSVRRVSKLNLQRIEIAFYKHNVMATGLSFTFPREIKRSFTISLLARGFESDESLSLEDAPHGGHQTRKLGV